jgi:hypothetical protein
MSRKRLLLFRDILNPKIVKQKYLPIKEQFKNLIGLKQHTLMQLKSLQLFETNERMMSVFDVI